MDKVIGMNPKPRHNHRLYLESLARLTPEQRLLKACELTELTRLLLREGLRRRFPDYTEEQLHAVYLERLEKCRSRNY